MIFLDFLALHPGLLIICAEEVLEILLNKAFFQEVEIVAAVDFAEQRECASGEERESFGLCLL